MKLHTISALLLALFAVGCIKEIKLNGGVGDLSTLVINGDFTNSAGTHTIRLSQPNQYGVASFSDVSGATVTLFDDNGNRAVYEETGIDSGIRYILPAGAMPALPGRAYHIEIQLSTGAVYRSTPEVLLPAIAIDTLLVEARTVNRTTLAGVVVEDRYGFVDVQTTVPANESEVFLRWDANCVYLFPEIPIPGPLPPPTHTCYVSEYFMDQQVKTLSLNNQNGKTIRNEIGGKPLDKAFQFKAYYNVVQKRVSPAAYDYFDRIGKISNPEGTVFDTPPGTLKGNCFNVNAADQSPLGYFEVAGIDTFRVAVNGTIFGSDFNYAPHCTTDDYYFNRDKECFDCLVLPFSTWIKPHYWRD